MQFRRDVFAGWLQIAQDGDSLPDGLEIVERERNFGGMGDGQQVQYGVGRAAGGHDHADGVFERLAGHDLAWQKLLLDGACYRARGFGGALGFLFVLGGHG